MTTRTPLELTGKIMSELMEMDRELSYRLDMTNEFVDRPDVYEKILDRRQIRQRMEELRAMDADDLQYSLLRAEL